MSALAAEVVAKLLARARAKHAQVAVSDEVFATRLAACVDGDALEQIRVEDLYLACGLAAGDKRALAIAETELVPDVKRAIGKIDAAPAFVDEITQRTRDKLFVGPDATIARYGGRGPLARWVSVVASRLALDEKRKRVDEPDDQLARIPAPDDPELALVWRDCADRYKAALAAVFAELDKRERNLLRQRYIDELNIDAIGRLYRVHPATAFRWLKAIEDKLAERTRATLMRELAISTTQLASMERLVASQLRISLTRMLRVRR